MLRTMAAVIAGKLTRAGVMAFGRGATALPGVVALGIAPDLIATLTRALPHGVTLVSGTNGKTTTARMLAGIVQAAGWSPVHNRTGSNLDRGIAATLAADATWTGAPRGDAGLFEVDEASLPRLLERIAPRVVAITNLFRDQLDRYFEIDALARRIGDAVAALPPSTTLVLNADDPIVAYLGDRHRGHIVHFGVDDPSVGGTVPQAISDATRCPRCHQSLAYRRIVLAHEGDWHCPSCGLARPPRDVAAASVALEASSSTLRLAGPQGGGAFDAVVVPLPGLYNAYNALAALAAARALDIPLATAVRAIAAFRPAFGRLEAVEAEGRTLRLVLVKNPAGFNAAIAALLETRRRPRLLAALNDRDADGRDVSWIWDADFETLAPAVEHAVVTGLRARDLALRFKYAGVDAARIEVVDGPAAALRRALDAAKRVPPRESRIPPGESRVPPGESTAQEIVVLATYTAMLALRGALADLGFVGRFWED